MTLFHKIALAAALLSLPQIARGQEASLAEPTPAPLTEQIAGDVARERAACAQYQIPRAETCVVEVEGADMLLNQYNSSRTALELSIQTALFFLKRRVDEATENYLTGRPLPMPALPGDSDMQTLDRKTDYHQQSANADVAKMTAERQCVADKRKMSDTLQTHRGHYETEFGHMDRDFPFLQRFTSYGAVKKAMFGMLDGYQKEVEAVQCSVAR